MNLRKKLLLNCFLGFLILPGFNNKLLANQLTVGSELAQNKDINKHSYTKKDSGYILGPGDALFIKFEGIDIFTSIYKVNFQNTIFMPEIDNINVEGLTILDLKKTLEKQYQDYVKDPQISISLFEPRPITVHLRGEVNKTGLFTLFFREEINNQEVYNLSGENLLKNENFQSNKNSKIGRVPRIFDLLQEGRGITKYADLSNITVTRINPKSNGGGKIIAKVDVLSLITEGDQSQNITLRDGDSINVPKSNFLIRDQLISLNKSNLTPDFIRVYINGNIPRPGVFKLNQGSSLLEGIATAGGKKAYSGKVEFIRFNNKGETKKEIITFNSSAEKGSRGNPILAEGDIIVLRKNFLGKTASIIDEFARPVVNAYGVYAIFD